MTGGHAVEVEGVAIKKIIRRGADTGIPAGGIDLLAAQVADGGGGAERGVGCGVVRGVVRGVARGIGDGVAGGVGGNMVVRRGYSRRFCGWGDFENLC